MNKMTTSATPRNTVTPRPIATPRNPVNTVQEVPILPRIFRAIENGNAELLRAVLDEGANPDLPVAGKTPLYIAADRGQAECVKVLLERGAHPDSFVNYSPHSTITIDPHADPNSAVVNSARWNGNAYPRLNQPPEGIMFSRDAPLHIAAKRNYTFIVNELLVAGAEVDIRDNTGRTPLLYAAEAGSVESLKWLLEFRASVKCKDGFHLDQSIIETALCLVKNYFKRNPNETTRYEEAVSLLVQHGASCSEARGGIGNTPLHHAVILGCDAAVKRLLDLGYQVNCQNSDGATPLYLAASMGHEEIVKILVEKNADVSMKNNEEKTALQEAVNAGSSGCIKFLIKGGADLAEEMKDGLTAVQAIANLLDGEQCLEKSMDQFITSESKKAGHLAGEKDFAVKFDYSPLLAVNESSTDENVKETCMNHMIQTRTCQTIMNQVQISQESADTSQVNQDDESQTQTSQIRVLSAILNLPASQTGILEHPLVESFLTFKWGKVKALYIAQFVLYVLLVLGVTVYCVLGVMKTWWGWPIGGYGLMMFKWILFALDLLILLFEVIQMSMVPRRYFRELENYLKLAFLLFAGLLLGFSVKTEFLIHFAAIAVFLGWAEITMQVGRLPYFGVLAHMFGAIAKDTLKCLFVFSFLLIGFSFSFHVLFELQSFSNAFLAILRTFGMITGDIDFKELFFRRDGKGDFSEPQRSVLDFALAKSPFSKNPENSSNNYVVNTTNNVVRNVTVDASIIEPDDDFFNKLDDVFEGKPEIFVPPPLPPPTYPYIVTSHVFYGLFIIFVTIVLMNLLIGLAVTNTSRLLKEGRLKRLQKQGRYVVFMESFLSSAVFCGCVDKNRKRLAIEKEVTFYPSDPKNNPFKLGKRTHENAIKICQKREQEKFPDIASVVDEIRDLGMQLCEFRRDVLRDRNALQSFQKP